MHLEKLLDKTSSRVQQCEGGDEVASSQNKEVDPATNEEFGMLIKYNKQQKKKQEKKEEDKLWNSITSLVSSNDRG